jgi:hypothetical protein
MVFLTQTEKWAFKSCYEKHNRTNNDFVILCYMVVVVLSGMMPVQNIIDMDDIQPVVYSKGITYLDQGVTLKCQPPAYFSDVAIAAMARYVPVENLINRSSP